MFCKYCGKEIADDAKFCPNCGARADAQVIIVQTEQPKEKQPIVAQPNDPNEGWKHAAAAVCLGISITNIPLAYFLSLYAIITSIICIILGTFGVASNNHRGKAITGLVFSTINLFVAIIFYAAINS